MNKMFNFNGMHKRSGRAGGKSVSMIGMLVLLLAALLVLPSCFDDDDDGASASCGDTTEYNADTGECDAIVDPGGTPVGEATCREGTEDDDTMLEAGSFPDNICGLGGNDTITGGPGNDTLDGGPGNDTLKGGAGDDTLKGGADNDMLYSGAGNDTLEGGAGDDELIVEGGNNMLDGGDDVDIAIYLYTGGVDANLAENKAQHLPSSSVSTNRFAGPGGGNDMLMNIENVKGSHTADILTGNGEDNLLKGLDGADTIKGGAGNDTIIPNRPMPPALNAAGNGLAEGETEPMDGVDTIDGGDDVDTVSYEGEAATFNAEGTSVAVRGLVIDLSAAPVADDANTEDVDESMPSHIAATLGTGGDGIADKIIVENKGSVEEPNWVSTIENVVGGGGDDNITGDERNNVLTGGPGQDTVSGGLGSDTVHADNADTDLDGGTGLLAEDNEETADVDESTAGDMDVLSFAGVEDTDTTNNEPDPTPDGVEKTIVDDGQTSGIRGFEHVMGSPQNDTFTAPAEGGVTIDGGGGADTLNGAAGDDTLMGGAGEDDIDGGGGADTLNGGPSEDTLTGEDGGDVFVLFMGEGPDTIDDYRPDEEGEEVHLKNFPSGSTATVGFSNATTVAITVGGKEILKFTAAAPVTLDEIVADLKKTGSITFVPTPTDGM